MFLQPSPDILGAPDVEQVAEALRVLNLGVLEPELINARSGRGIFAHTGRAHGIKGGKSGPFRRIPVVFVPLVKVQDTQFLSAKCDLAPGNGKMMFVLQPVSDLLIGRGPLYFTGYERSPLFIHDFTDKSPVNIPHDREEEPERPLPVGRGDDALAVDKPRYPAVVDDRIPVFRRVDCPGKGCEGQGF